MHGNYALGKKRYVDFGVSLDYMTLSYQQFLVDDETIVNQLLDGANK